MTHFQEHWKIYTNTANFKNTVMHGMSRDVCMSSRTCIHYLNWSPDPLIFLEVEFLWAPLVRSVRIVKCRYYFPDTCTGRHSRKAFIYSLTNNHGSGLHAVYNPVKLRVKPDMYNQAVNTCDSNGPVFGWLDIYISNNAASNQDSETRCGYSYPLPPGYSLSGDDCKFYAGSHRFTPTDIEVFYETTT